MYEKLILTDQDVEYIQHGLACLMRETAKRAKDLDVQFSGHAAMQDEIARLDGQYLELQDLLSRISRQLQENPNA